MPKSHSFARSERGDPPDIYRHRYARFYGRAEAFCVRPGTMAPDTHYRHVRKAHRGDHRPSRWRRVLLKAVSLGRGHQRYARIGDDALKRRPDLSYYAIPDRPSGPSCDGRALSGQRLIVALRDRALTFPQPFDLPPVDVVAGYTRRQIAFLEPGRDGLDQHSEDAVTDELMHPLWAPGNLRRALQAAGVALWSWNVDTDQFTMDSRAFEMWDVPQSGSVTFEDLSAHIHPADLDRVRAAFTATRAVVGEYEIDFRIIVAGRVRWISARGLGNDSGLHERHMFGVFLDVTGRKQAEEGHELLAGEMSHRVKNLLAIALALTQISSRSTSTVTEMAKELTGRLAALGRAHDLVRPLPGGQGKAALLGDVISILLSPYDDMGAFAGRIRVAVPRMGVGEVAATSIALAFHELATNSLKYGALSAEAGTLDISGTAEDGMVTVLWTERGGPPVPQAERSPGYGSKLLDRSISVQLAGTITHDWSADGLIVRLNMSAEKLAA